MDELQIAPLDHEAATTARQIHAVQMVAYRQEAALLGIGFFAPLEHTVADIQTGGERYLGARLGMELVGAVGLAHDDGAGRLHIASLVVRPEHQRRRVASRLLAAALAGHEAGCASVATAAMNLPALRLYAAFGFVEHLRLTVGPQALELVQLRRCRPPSPCRVCGGGPLWPHPVPPAAAD